MKRLPLILLSLILLASCNRTVLEEERTFANSNWKFFQPEEFNLNIKNIDDCYNIYATVVIDTAQFKMSRLPLFVNLYSPNGERRSFTGYLLPKDELGKWNGDFKDGKLVCTRCIREYFFFNVTGDHTIEVSQYTHRYDLNGIESFTLKIEKADVIYPD